MYCNMNGSLKKLFSAFKINPSSIGHPGLGRPTGQVNLGRLKSPPKIMFGTGSNAESTVFTLWRGTMKSSAVDGFPLVSSVYYKHCQILVTQRNCTLDDV